MKTENKITHDDELKDLFAASKIKARENLKYRIMQQVETESLLAGRNKKEKKINLQIKTILTLAGIMYALIVGIAGAIYLSTGTDALLSSEFIMTITFITVITIMFGLISYIDSNIRATKKKH